MNRRIERGRRAREQGRRAEWTAALWLMLKGYQVLGFRLKDRLGEIDLLARKGGVLAVVEVKRRASVEAALESLGTQQRARLLSAGQAWIARRPALKGLDLRLDMVTLAPGRFPRHVRGLIVDR
ncbi:YraN family protein [Brevundimonas sp. 2R-24]|uniref:UPF0102 protein Q0812_11950 n=1 Tax=Peiella sedimenti TaxID=3061083 RepID=A0ABT8SNS0_9CAUL|nr:YraN family protein [Caulobacteraceae bacterium XZ-24]